MCSGSIVAHLGYLKFRSSAIFLEVILSRLSQTILCVIPDMHYVGRLGRLLDIFFTWGSRPVCQCSTISESIRRFERSGITSESPPRSHYDGTELSCARLWDDNNPYVSILSTALAVGFRQIGLDHTSSEIRLTHTSHYEPMFDNVFASEDDDVVADVVSVWIVNLLGTPSGSCARRLARLAERSRPFSQRLRWTIV